MRRNSKLLRPLVHEVRLAATMRPLAGPSQDSVTVSFSVLRSHVPDIQSSAATRVGDCAQASAGARTRAAASDRIIVASPEMTAPRPADRPRSHLEHRDIYSTSAVASP